MTLINNKNERNSIISLTQTYNAEYCHRQIPHSVNKYKRASITVEAALAFPVFFLACMALCYLFIFLRTEYMVQRELYYTARSVSVYGDIVEPVVKAKNRHLEDAGNSLFAGADKGLRTMLGTLAEKLAGVDDFSIEGLISGAADNIVVGAVVRSQLSEEVFKYIRGGSSGMDFTGSVLFDQDKCIRIVCSYELVIPGGIFSSLGIPVEHNIKYRYFCGTEVESLLSEVEESEEPAEETGEDEIVLITDTGYCYHISYSCPSLNIRPKEAKTAELESLRNDGGAKYYACEFCVKRKTKKFDCYITPEGDRYHYDKKCQGLKRTIYEVKLSEVGKKRACKRCAKK